MTFSAFQKTDSIKRSSAEVFTLVPDACTTFPFTICAFSRFQLNPNEMCHISVHLWLMFYSLWFCSSASNCSLTVYKLQQSHLIWSINTCFLFLRLRACTVSQWTAWTMLKPSSLQLCRWVSSSPSAPDLFVLSFLFRSQVPGALWTRHELFGLSRYWKPGRIPNICLYQFMHG